jgi:general secretion pathway protein J
VKPPAQPAPAIAGFTLLELLVAMAIFAVVGALALGGLNTVLTQQEIAHTELAELQRLQRAMRLITADFAQINPRVVRDQFIGDTPEPSLLADGRGDFLVRMTRDGWPNPFSLQARGTLQRVQYRLEDRKLLREYWPVLDATLATEARSEVLLDRVDAVEIHYCGIPETSFAPDECVTQWPTPQQGQSVGTANPRAVRVILTVEGWGDLVRFVELPS